MMKRLITKDSELNDHEREILSELEDTYCGAHMMDDASAMIRVARAIAAFRCSTEVGEEEIFGKKFLEEWYGV